MTSPVTLARIAAEIRSLPARNPAFGSDAMLLMADALTEGAIALSEAGRAELSAALRDLAGMARTLAPIFAPPPISAEAATHILARQE